MVYFGVRYRGFAVSDRSLPPTQIDLRPLAEAELPLDREFAPEQVMGGQTVPRGKAADEEFTIAGPVRFTGTLTRAGGPIAQLAAQYPETVITVESADLLELPPTDRDLGPKLGRPRL